MDLQQAKKLVLDSAKKAFDDKLFAGTSGNLSVYLRDQGLVAITPSSIRYEGMQLDDIVIIDLDGNVVEGKHKPSSEYKLHCGLYKGREDASAVVHTHSPYATAFAVNNKRIPLVLIEMILFIGGDVPVAKAEIQGSEEVGTGAVKAMEGRFGCLLGNHGVVTVGKDMDEAYIRAEYVEDAAKICSIAINNGPIQDIPEDIVQVMMERLK